MRLGTQVDASLIVKALGELQKRSPNPQMQYSDLTVAARGVNDFIDSGRCLIVGDYAILFEIGKIWYSATEFMMEQLLIRFKSDEGNSVHDAVSGLELFAKEYGCSVLIVGDTQIGHMTKVYTEHGFVPIGTQLLKQL
jgi:hypothetical protein